MDKRTTEGSYITWPGEMEMQIRAMCWNGDEPIKSHRHDFIEIAFLAKGSCMHTYLGSKVKLIPGDLFVITPHEEHSYEITAKTVIYNCLFYPGALGEDWNRLKKNKSIYDLLIVEPFYRPESGHQEILHLSPPEAQEVELLLKKMIEEQENKLDGFDLVQKANLVIFLCYIGRAWKNQFVKNSTVYNNMRDMLSEAVMHIEKNLKDQITIEELASKAYLSPSYFRKLFKEVTGLSPIDYINKIRITKAKQLLLEQSMTVAEVAEAVGINDQNYFARLFKAIAGCTPREFRKKSE